MKRWKFVFWLVLIPMVLAGCSGAPDPEVFTYDFSEADEGWLGDFTDYPVAGEDDLYDLDFAHRELPEELEMEGKALMLKGANSSDDLFMYLRKQVTGLAADAEYELIITVTFATDAPAGAVGIGGPPGEAVFVKVGGSTEEPLPETSTMGGEPYYVLSVDKGAQSEGGEQAVVVGDVAKENNDEFDVYELKTLSNEDKPLTVRTDGEGRVWIFVGTDSGFEGITTLYYTEIQIEMTAK